MGKARQDRLAMLWMQEMARARQMKIPISDQITEARLHLSTLPPGHRRDAMEGVVLTLEFMKVYRDDFYSFMAERSRQPK